MKLGIYDKNKRWLNNLLTNDKYGLQNIKLSFTVFASCFHIKMKIVVIDASTMWSVWLLERYAASKSANEMKLIKCNSKLLYTINKM